jgi:hypothetical protein
MYLGGRYLWRRILALDPLEARKNGEVHLETNQGSGLAALVICCQAPIVKSNLQVSH